MTNPRPGTPEQALDRLADLELALGTQQILDEIAELRDLLTREAAAIGLTIPTRDDRDQ